MIESVTTVLADGRGMCRDRACPVRLLSDGLTNVNPPTPTA